MGTIYNIYCDESCHLEHDRQNVMVLGAVWCPLEDTRTIAEDVRQIKKQHGLSSKFEVKWTKVSPAKVDFYLDIIDYFFKNDGLGFRAVVIPDKSKLRHGAFDQTHDDWFYKMYYTVLKTILEKTCKYRIYLDIKDTRTAAKVRRLHEVLCSGRYDFDQSIIERIQDVHSHEVEHIQLVDLLIGAVSYANRALSTSPAKKALVDKVQILSGHPLTGTTPLNQKKHNILIWRAQEEPQ